MASSPTTRNRLNKQGTGDNTGTWGSVLNTQGIDLIDEALDGLTSIAISGNVTLSSTNYATDQSRKRVLRLTGAPGASYTVTIPSVEKFYVVLNSTNAAQTIKAGGVGVSIPPAVMTTVICDGTDCFAPAQTVAAAIGSVVDFAGSTAPSGWLLCYGQAVSRSTYAALFGVLGTTYGAGDGSTTFTLPDLRGRAVIGKDDMGGAAASRVTAAVSGITATNLGAAGGDQNIPLHGHGVTDPGHNHAITDPGHTHAVQQIAIDGTQSTTTVLSNTSGGATSILSNTTGITINNRVTGLTVNNAGTGTAANIPPAIVLNKIIYAGV